MSLRSPHAFDPSGEAPALGGAGGPSGLDRAALDLPMIAIHGEFNAPFTPSARLWREVRHFQDVVLPVHNHRSALMIGGPMPPEYLEAIAGFIATYDERPSRMARPR